MTIGFGMMLPHEGATWDFILHNARAAESAGFDAVWLDDHFFPPLFDTRPEYLECWSVLAALASATTTIRLGSMVSAAGYRNPAVLAKMAATIDHISNGRLEFGLGAGWSEPEARAYGFDFHPIKARAQQLEEAIQIAIAMWTEDEATVKGEFFRVEKAVCNPKPVQKPHPPIWVGGGGETRILPIAARYAQYSNFGALLEDVPRKVELLKKYAKDAPPRASLFTRMFVAEGAQGEEYRKRGEGRPNIAGTPEQCAEQMAAYVEAGIDYFVLTELHRPGAIDLAATVLPMVRQMTR